MKVIQRNLGAILAPVASGIAVIDVADPSQVRELDYTSLDCLADGVARRLIRDGVLPGERIAIFGENSFEFLAVLLGSMRAGAVAVPINIKQPDATVDFIIEDAAVDLVFSDPALAQRVPASCQTQLLEAQALSQYVDDGKFSAAATAKDDIALVLYTSGSTGRPKGVLLSHASQWFMVDSLGDALAGQTAAVAAPLYHMNGMLMSFLLLNRGGTIVLMPRFRPRDYLEAVARFAVTAVTGVPTMLALMAREDDLLSRLKLDHVETVLIGSSPLSQTTVACAQRMFPRARIANSYGTTETGTGMFGPHPNGIPTPAMALGYATLNTDVRLVGGADETQGVLEVRSPAAMHGYLNLPEKTAARTTADGFITTGDVMRRDAHGFFYFVGRDDDMFVCGGENVFPGEIERLLERDPRIAEACVVPVADDIRGQMPVAFVTLAADSDIDEAGVKAIVLAGAPAYMHPRRVVILATMPLAGTNKVDRQALQLQAENSATAL